MKTVETENQGLKRAYTLTIEAKEIEARVEQEVRRLAPQVRMPGFRPGKVPANLIKKMHGDSLQGEALNSAVQEGVQKLLAEQKLRPALQPQVELVDGYAPGKDAEVKVSLEALPDIAAPSIEGLKLERLTVEPDEAAVDEQLQRLASSNKSWEDAPEGKAAENGDLVVMDFVGTVDGEKFDGGSGEDMQIELGSGNLIPGFEEGLQGVKVGDNRDVKVTFPDDYPSEKVKGKPANFAVTIKAVKVAGETKVDEDFAKTLGLDSLDKLKEILRDQQGQELNNLTRTHMKRRLLDQLAAAHDFPVPDSMVDAEFNNIMAQLRHEAEHEDDTQAALAELDKETAEYRKIAERRVRLGLLLSEIGAANGVDITEQEMNRLVMQAASQYQPKDRERFIQYIQQEPMAAAQLRAPLYEDKVVDFLFSKAEITERAATRAELEADLESEEGHVHGPGCGHDHGDHAHEAKPAKKGKAKAAKAEESAAVAEPAAEAKPAKKVAPKKAKLTEEDAAPKPAKPLKSEPADKAAAAEAAPKKAPAKKAKAAK
ncbi:trigger factor [Sphingomonas piscis]|uniref:Trigger factor n=1 Tax=Sphingomonas piscis TaxID=2714943 RepID=A0A6G7YS57_9SPHN|nr:trigger factor [Sphingomonas piscis]QIK79576.1 trigger factor [Sphingomonas piscis]